MLQPLARAADAFQPVEEARPHHPARRRGGCVAVRGARAAGRSNSGLARPHPAAAGGCAASKISQFIKEIESQVGWTTHLPWSAGTAARRFDGLRLLRQVPVIVEVSQLDASGIEQLRVSRLSKDVVATGADLSMEPKFVEAVANKVYYGPVYFRRQSEPFMTIALAGTRRDAGVSVAEVGLKLVWDIVKMKVGERGIAYVVDAKGRLIAHPDISLVLRNTDMSKLAHVRAALGGTIEPVQEGEDIEGDRMNRRRLTNLWRLGTEKGGLVEQGN